MPFNSMPPPDSGASPVGAGVMTRSRWASRVRNSALDPDLQNKLDALAPTKQIDDCHHIALDAHMDAFRQLREPDDSFCPGQRDFSLTVLPPNLLLYIYSCLEETDRLKLSVTCRTLHNLYTNTSVLWRTATIRINSEIPCKKACLNKTEQSVLRAHGHHIQNITFQATRPMNLHFDNDTHRLLVGAAKRWPLKTMKIVFGKLGPEPIVPKRRRHVDDLLTACLTARSTRQLNTLFVWASNWVNEDGKSCVVQALKRSSFTSSLNTLYLGHMPPHTYDPSDLSMVMGRFENLKELAIQLSNLSNSLMVNFPKHLEKIYIIMNKCDDSREITTWPSVLASRPKLTVGLLFHGDSYCHSVSQVLPSVVPVSTINIDNPVHGHYNCQIELLQLLPMYCLHLKVLTCVYNEYVVGRETVLIQTVNQCLNLDSLSFDGRISSEAVITLARTKTWKQFEFSRASICFRDSSDREKQLQALCEEVSSALGRDWKPQPRKGCTHCQFCGGHTHSVRPLSMEIAPKTIRI